MIWLILACGGAPSGDSGLCGDAPVLTWDNFGQGLLIEACQTCHARTTADRRGAPAEVSFDTREDTLAHRERILDAATGADPRMPPEGGLSEADRAGLEIWLRCWETE